jgi:CxxC-x17-CxxC domain-containing protein
VGLHHNFQIDKPAKNLPGLEPLLLPSKEDKGYGSDPLNNAGWGISFTNQKTIVAIKTYLGCTIGAQQQLLGRPVMAGDMQLTCSDCGQEFTFTAADQQFFSERGFSTPKRCKPCRQAKKADGGGGGGGYRSAPAQGTPVICSGCGQPTTVPFEPRGDRPVYCRDCYVARKGGGGGGRGR